MKASEPAKADSVTEAVAKPPSRPDKYPIPSPIVAEAHAKIEVSTVDPLDKLNQKERGLGIMLLVMVIYPPRLY